MLSIRQGFRSLRTTGEPGFLGYANILRAIAVDYMAGSNLKAVVSSGTLASKGSFAPGHPSLGEWPAAGLTVEGAVVTRPLGMGCMLKKGTIKDRKQKKGFASLLFSQ